MAFCLIAGQRFSEALTRANTYNEELAREVAIAKDGMARAYAELAEARGRELIMSERQRITRDVHDGVGGKLTGVLYMARNPDIDAKMISDIAMEIEESLLDLRSIIDALDNDIAQDFAHALRKFESKVRPWLEQHGLQVEIEVQRCDVTQPVPSSWLLTVFRLLQESVSNIVKHAQADCVKVCLDARETTHNKKTMVMTVFDDETSVMNAIAAGADGYFVKQDPHITEAMRAVMSNGNPVSASVVKYFLKRLRTRVDKTVELTPRESQTLTALAEGLKYDDIALRLKVSKHTIPDYIKSLYAKLGVHDKSSAVYVGVQKGLISVGDSG